MLEITLLKAFCISYSCTSIFEILHTRLTVSEIKQPYSEVGRSDMRKYRPTIRVAQI